MRRRLTPNEFNKESLKDAQILECVPKVKAVLEPSFESRFPAEQPCKVVIKLTNGETLMKERAFPKGDPRDQLSTEELQQKFAILAEEILNEAQKETIYQTVNDLENIGEIGDLMKLLVK